MWQLDIQYIHKRKELTTLDLTVHTCCFLGHKEICETEELNKQLLQVIEHLIAEKNVDTFLFGSKSRFNQLCYDLVTKLKEKYSNIKRVYVRAEFPIITDSYQKYLLEWYENTYYPETIIGAGKAVYVKRNQTMIDNSHYCIFYYDEKYTPYGRKSGTKHALDYAQKHNRTIYRFPHFQSVP